MRASSARLALLCRRDHRELDASGATAYVGDIDPGRLGSGTKFSAIDCARLEPSRQLRTHREELGCQGVCCGGGMSCRHGAGEGRKEWVLYRRFATMTG